MPFVEGSEQPEEDFRQINSTELEAPRLNYKNGSRDFRLTLIPYYSRRRIECRGVFT
jgi:hypothetical protein